MTETPDQRAEEAELDALFAAARAHPPVPPEALMARVADAAAAEAAARPTAAPVALRPRGLRMVVAGLGGWPGLAGLATAAAAGIVIGVAVPETLHLLEVGAGFGYDLSGFQPGYGVFLGEEG